MQREGFMNKGHLSIYAFVGFFVLSLSTTGRAAPVASIKCTGL